MVRRVSGRALAIRHSGDVLLGGAPGAGRLLHNTKASQEAACSRAPAAIVPGQAPELRDAGVSRFVGNGSHPAGADAADAVAGQDARTGDSGFARLGSHLARTDGTEGLAGHVGGPGGSGNAGIGSHLAAAEAAEGHAGQVESPGSSEFAKNG